MRLVLCKAQGLMRPNLCAQAVLGHFSQETTEMKANKKKLHFVASALALCAVSAHAVEIAGIDFSGYTRGGFYSSSAGAPRGGYSLGGDAQKFRLGNEGDHGIELGLAKTFDVGSGQKMGVAYMPAVWNGTSSTVEAYGTFSGLSFAPEAVIWGGQRRLRIQDVHIVDKFFADYGDNLGAGFTGLKAGPVTLGMALFSGDSFDNKGSNPNRARRFNLDVSDIATNPGGDLHVTLTAVQGDFAYGGNGSGLSLLHNQKDFLVAGLKHALFVQASNGHAGLNGQFTGLDAPGSTSLVVGNGGVVTQVMNPAVPNPGQKSWRLVDSLNWQAGRFGGQTVAAYQESKAEGGPTDGVLTKDTSLGGRVSYAVTGNLKMLAELGVTSRAISGQATQRLNKLTIAPALSLGGDFWTRPELRFYATRVTWNDAAAAAQSYGADGRTSSTLFGVQLEAWW
jgi:maltoporin